MGTIRARQADASNRMVTDHRAKEVRLSGQQELVENQGTELERLQRHLNNMSAELHHTRRTQLAQSDAQISAGL